MLKIYLVSNQVPNLEVQSPSIYSIVSGDKHAPSHTVVTKKSATAMPVSYVKFCGTVGFISPTLGHLALDIC